MITIQHVTKKYGKSAVLKDVTVDFADGMIHGIIGRNGSGKTVLMKCICGLTNPTEGEILVDGKRIDEKSGCPDHTGVLIESPGFLAGYSGFKNLQYLATLKNTIGKAEIRAAIEQVGLDPCDKKPVNKYSLGMRQTPRHCAGDHGAAKASAPRRTNQWIGQARCLRDPPPAARPESTGKNHPDCIAHRRRYSSSVRYRMRNGGRSFEKKDMVRDD